MNDLRQTAQYAKYLRLIGWDTENIHGVYYFIRQFPLFGSVMKIQRPREFRLKDIEALQKKYKVRRILAEPKTEMEARYLLSVGYKQNKSPHLPTKSLQIDLTLPKKVIVSSMHAKTRYNSGRANKYGIKVEKSHEIDKFWNFWKNHCPQKTPPFLSLRKNSTQKMPPFFYLL